MARRRKNNFNQDFKDEAESEVVKQAMEGNDLAFNELVLRHSARIRNRLRQLSGQPSLADDLAQIAFVQAWKNIKRLQAPGAFSIWLNRIALNVWLDEVRRKMLPLADDEALEAVADHNPGPDTQATGLDLERALATLGIHERLCVVLAYNDGYTSEEISELIGLPIGTVKSHIRRGSAKVRQRLGTYDDHER